MKIEQIESIYFSPACLGTNTVRYLSSTEQGLIEIFVAQGLPGQRDKTWIRLTPEQVRNELLPELCGLLDDADGNPRGTTRIYTSEHKVPAEPQP